MLHPPNFSPHSHQRQHTQRPYQHPLSADVCCLCESNLVFIFGTLNNSSYIAINYFRSLYLYYYFCSKQTFVSTEIFHLSETENFCQLWLLLPITVAEWSKARTVFARSNAGIIGSNPIQDMDVCILCIYSVIVLCVGRGLAKGLSPVQGVLPTVYRISKLKKRPRPNKGL
jgi:hypothetical protein